MKDAEEAYASYVKEGGTLSLCDWACPATGVVNILLIDGKVKIVSNPRNKL